MSTALNKKSRRPLVYALIVIFLWFGASGVFGPLFGKLSTVQENDNSAFLPDSAESTQAAKIIEKFNQDQNQNLPTLVLYVGEVDALAKQYENCALTSSSAFIAKEHPAFEYYPGIKDSRDWMFPNTEGYYPSFFSFWKKGISAKNKK